MELIGEDLLAGYLNAIFTIHCILFRIKLDPLGCTGVAKIRNHSSQDSFICPTLQGEKHRVRESTSMLSREKIIDCASPVHYSATLIERVHEGWHQRNMPHPFSGSDTIFQPLLAIGQTMIEERKHISILIHFFGLRRQLTDDFESQKSCNWSFISDLTKAAWIPFTCEKKDWENGWGTQ